MLGTQLKAMAGFQEGNGHYVLLFKLQTSKKGKRTTIKGLTDR